MSISVIVPCYNEDVSIKLFLDKFYEVMNKNNFSSFEVIFVNDGSEDKTTETINNYAKIDKRIKLISFSRNFQKEAAMLAGLDNAKGDAIVVIDADLQHPIDAIALFYQKIKEGYNIVYGVKKSRKKFIKDEDAIGHPFWFVCVNSWFGWVSFDAYHCRRRFNVPKECFIEKTANFDIIPLE